MADTFHGWALGPTRQAPQHDPVAPPPTFRFLRITTTCRECVAGMPAHQRCTTDHAALRAATVDDLLAQTVPGACACDLDDEIGRRLGYPVPSPSTSPRPGILARIFRRSPK